MADLKSRFKSFIGFGNVAEDYEVFDEYEDEEDIGHTADVEDDEDYSFTAKDRFANVSARSAEQGSGSSAARSTASSTAGSAECSGERGKVLNMGMSSYPQQITLTLNLSSPLISKLESMEGEKQEITAAYLYGLAQLSQKKLSAEELQKFLSDSYTVLGLL